VEGNKRGANIGMEFFRHDHTHQRGGVKGEEMRERGLGGSFGPYGVVGVAVDRSWSMAALAPMCGGSLCGLSRQRQ
jgi:hypothetical protein